MAEIRTSLEDLENAISYLNKEKSVEDIEEIYGNFNDPTFQSALREAKLIVGKINQGIQLRDLMVIRQGLQMLANSLKKRITSTYKIRGLLYRQKNKLSAEKQAFKKAMKAVSYARKKAPQQAHWYNWEQTWGQWQQDVMDYSKKLMENLDEQAKNYFVLNYADIMMDPTSKAATKIFENLQQNIDSNKKAIATIEKHLGEQAKEYHTIKAKEKVIKNKILMNQQLIILDIIGGVFNQVLDINYIL